jgi:translation initiation factor IF-1
MGKADLIEMEGKVTEICKGGVFRVLLTAQSNSLPVQAKLSGRLRHFKIRIVEGDLVLVGMSPYDPARGLITRRL